MKFLLDENISKTVTRHLRDAGFDVVHILEIMFQGKPDEAIINRAIEENRIIITHDKDFGNLLRFPLQQHNGVIMMRFHNQIPRNTAAHLLDFLSKNKSLQLQSRLVILRESGWRII
jgi:predicted nuclease of predicted toxin-antitoxin system